MNIDNEKKVDFKKFSGSAPGPPFDNSCAGSTIK